VKSSHSSPQAIETARYSPDPIGRVNYSPLPSVKDLRPSIDLQLSDADSEGGNQVITAPEIQGEELEDMGLRDADVEQRGDSKVDEQADVEINDIVPRRHDGKWSSHRRNSAAKTLPSYTERRSQAPNDSYQPDSNLSVPGGRQPQRRDRRTSSLKKSNNRLYLGEGTHSADFDQAEWASDSVLPGMVNSYADRPSNISLPKKPAMRNSNGRTQNRPSSSLGNDEELLSRLRKGEVSPGKPSLRKSRNSEKAFFKKNSGKSLSGEWFGKKKGPRRGSSLRFACDEDTNKQSGIKPHRRSKSTDTESPRRSQKSGRQSRVSTVTKSGTEPQSTSTSNPRLQFNRSASARNIREEERGRGKVKSRNKVKNSMPEPGGVERSASAIDRKEESSASKFKRSASMGNLKTRDEKGKKLSRSRSRTELKQLLVERGRSRSKSRSRRRSLSRSRSRSRSREGSQDLEDDSGFGRKKTYRFGNRQIQMIMPSDLPDEEILKERPDKWLRLEHIHGYSGFNALARQNLFFREGCLIYYIACAGVVHRIKTNSQRFFLFHDEDISSMAVHPTFTNGCYGSANS